MKNRNLIFYILIFLPLVITVLVLPFFPESVPMHYDPMGNINRWGSKYEQLILPVLTIGFGYFMLALSKMASKKEQGTANEKATIIVSIASVLIFNITNAVFLYKAFFASTDKIEPVKVDIFQVIFITVGVAVLIMGNIMQKCKMNSIIGLRTTWSMKSDRIWFLSQRFGGVSFMISGLVIIIGNSFLKGIVCFIFTMIIMLIDLIASLIGSYLIYKKNIGD